MGLASGASEVSMSAGRVNCLGEGGGVASNLGASSCFRRLAAGAVGHEASGLWERFNFLFCHASLPLLPHSASPTRPGLVELPFPRLFQRPPDEHSKRHSLTSRSLPQRSSQTCPKSSIFLRNASKRPDSGCPARDSCKYPASISTYARTPLVAGTHDPS